MDDEVRELFDWYEQGRVSRSQFLVAAAKLGLSAAAVGVLAKASPAYAGLSSGAVDDQWSERSALWSERKARNQLILAAPGTPAGLDSEFYGGSSFNDCGVNLNEGLTRWKTVPSPDEKGGYDIAWHAENPRGTTSPGLAKSWTISNGGKTYTFHLGDWVSHAGNPLTAADVKWHFDRAFALKAIGLSVNLAANLLSADDVVVLDAKTVRFTISAPSDIFLETTNNLIRCGIVDSTEAKKHATNADPWATTWLKNNWPGFGPYKVQSLTPGTSTVWAAHNSTSQPPKIGSVTFQAVPTSATRIGLLSAGQVDVAQLLSPIEVASVIGVKGVRVWKLHDNKPTYVVMNSAIPPFDNKLVRVALSYAVPYDSMVKYVYRGFADKAAGPIPSKALTKNARSYYAKSFPYKFDLAMAKKLLAAAGLPKGFTTSFTYDSSDPIAEAVGVTLRTTFKDIGVTLNLNGTTSAGWNQALSTKSAPMIFSSTGPNVPDPHYILYILAGATGQNISNYKNAHFNDLLNQAIGVSDAKKARKLNIAAFQSLVQDPPVLWIAEPRMIIAARNDLTGINWYINAPRWNEVSFT